MWASALDKGSSANSVPAAGLRAELIATTVAAWDPELTSRRVELAIGRDLQFIRINGTIVGGLAGTLIYLISSLFP
jgi:uncharacterized membrane-anchored protein YjiN (DUF445 family)